MTGLRTQQSARFPGDFRMLARASLALAAMVACAPPAQAQSIQVTAPHAVLMDFETGSILYSRGADEPLPPANIAKLMTLAVVFGELKSGKITLDTEFQVSNYAWRTGGAPSGMSTMFAALRSRIRVEDLIIGVAALSGNDGAIVLAEGIAGSEQAFVRRMNEYATKLALTSARFHNATGAQHPEQRISARDLMKLAAHLIREYPDYYKYFKVPEMTWSKIKQSNRNPLLGSSSLGVDGLITGSTKESGYGFVASADNNGQRLIVVVQGSRSEKDRVEDARRLLDWGFRAFGDRLLITGSNEVARASVYGGTQGTVALTAKNDLHILSLLGTNERFTARVVYEGPLRAPIVKGSEVAKLRVFRGDQIAYEAPLFAAEDVPLGGLFGRAFDSAYEFVASVARSAMRKVFTRNS
jgi:D-alanyl-D-alanine carboxypeptidase (penicillin-binding protein 5/6)